MRNFREVLPEPEIELSEDYFESTSLKNAVWQYLIDHSTPVHGGMARIKFHITEEKEFWRRVRARRDGRFNRKDLRDFEAEMEKKSRAFFELCKAGEKWRQHCLHNNIYANNIQEGIINGTFVERHALILARFLRKCGRLLTAAMLRRLYKNGRLNRKHGAGLHERSSEIKE